MEDAAREGETLTQADVIKEKATRRYRILGLIGGIVTATMIVAADRLVKWLG